MKKVYKPKPELDRPIQTYILTQRLEYKIIAFIFLSFILFSAVELNLYLNHFMTIMTSAFTK
jgi:hypothetical protein